MNIRILPPEEIIEATVNLPLSKSICNRLLIINALTPGSQPMETIADCDDSRSLRDAIAAVKAGATEVNVGAAGTAMRFMTAYLATLEGVTVTIDGSERMRRRPMSPLIDALRLLGADITCLGEEGHAPMRITGRRLAGGQLTIDASVSSQFISALMMIGPTMAAPLSIRLDGEIISRPYILMTASLMRGAGVEAELDRDVINIASGSYRPADLTIEPDWSAASYWYSISALSAGFITLPGLKIKSLQGDSRCAPYFDRLGVVTAESEETPDALDLLPSPEQHSRFEEDLSETPDIAQTIAVTAAMLGIPFHLRGLASLKVKETDRLVALQNELDKLGIIAEIRHDSEIVWNGERHPIFEIPRIATYDDHRMALSFAAAAIYLPGLVIEDCEVVSKSYPGFWDDLRAAGFTITDADEPAEEQETEE